METSLWILLIISLVAACAFEFINGFHDTANAVATVIYTKAMKPMVAVVWSGIFNFLGVFLGGIAVAMGIINLLPMEALTDQNVYHSIALILSLIVTAIIWNLGTWYIGLPCSSSHTLLGSIFGVGIAYMLLPDVGNVDLNWGKIKDAGLSLLISPLIGFGLTMGVMYLLKKVTKKNKVLFEHNPDRKTPPKGVRALLILTCTSVSFTHGSNDGQKGVGLILIILLAFMPAKFAIDQNKSADQLRNQVVSVEQKILSIDTALLTSEYKEKYTLILNKTNDVKNTLQGVETINSIEGKKSMNLRSDITIIAKESNNFLSAKNINNQLILQNEASGNLKKDISHLKSYYEYAPWWVLLMVSLSLGFGTMIGWKRIVVTVGEKIGKTHLTYAQGASAELVAASTIALSTGMGLPVSTTHVLSSGIAGSMVSSNGIKNLRMKTVKNILIAWLITLPVTFIISGALFLLFRWLIG